MRKYKVLFILHLPLPVHGAAVVGQCIKESAIVNQSFEADYINLSTSESLQQIGNAGMSKITRLVKIQLKVLKALMSKRYDLSYVTITAHGIGFYKDLITVAILKLFQKKIIYHFHNKGVSLKQNNLLDHLLYKFTFSKTKSILLSPQLYYDVKKYVRKENIFFCANGIKGRMKWSIPEIRNKGQDHPCRLLFLSNMIIEKGVLVLLQACKLLKEKNLRFECHFVGDWFNISEIEFSNVVSEFGLQSCVFAHGKKIGNDKLYYFANADIFVFPTFYDCFPLVLLEAMEFGLPVVSTYEGGVPDIVSDGETGFLVPQQNFEALAEKLELLIQQPTLCRKMGTAGRKKFEDHFTIEKFENNVTTILEKAIINK